MLRPCLVAILLALPATLSAQAVLPVATALPNGVEIHAGETTLRITALRPDVLRIRASHTAPLPEDASWAVLPEARTAVAAVTQDNSAADRLAGFHTAALAFAIGPDLRMTLRDASGQVLLTQPAPIRWDGKAFSILQTRTLDDHVFGLGDKPGPLDRSGKSYVMWNTDDFGWQESSDPIYKSIPFYLQMRQGHALGVFLDNTWRTWFDFGHRDAHATEIGAPDGPLDLYLITGPDPKQVVTAWGWLTGRTPMPPRWVLGYQQSRWSYEPESKLVEIADRLRADRIPADAVYLDIDYQVKARPFTIDEQKFPGFPALVQKLRDEQFHLVVITDLHIANLPGQGYAPYDSGMAGDHFVKLPSGAVYTAQVWPGPAVFPDFSRAVTRDWWGSQYAPLVKDGVAGFWNDMNEPAVFNVPTKTMPDDVVHRIDDSAATGFHNRTATHLEMHNVYGMLNTEGTWQGLRKLAPDVRPFVLTRASYAGGQRSAATWTGDNSSTWNHLRMTIPQLENLGLSGFAIAGADVGGFAGSPSPDLLTRWIELAAFQPLDRDHASKGTRDHEPWVDGPAHEAIRRHFIETRYKLMPYLYTVAEESARTGLPIMRPLFLEFPNALPAGHPLDIDAAASGEFMVGSRLLVAASPSPDEVAPYAVTLPPGAWYDFWNGTRFDSALAGPRDLEQKDAPAPKPPVTIAPKLAELPVYVRAGTILPMAPLTQSTDEKPSGPLELRVYLDPSAAPGTSPCAGTLYDDDGISYGFTRGLYLRVAMRCEARPGGTLAVVLDKQEGRFQPWFTQVHVTAYGLAGKSPGELWEGTANWSARGITIPLR